VIADLLPLLTAATGVAAALVGGIFFAFSSFVMAGLDRAGPEAGIRAMQQINITVINPLFFLFFLGTAALTAIVATMALLSASAGLPIAFGAALYIVGCLGVTGTRNVPLNKGLEHVVPGTPKGNAFWMHYLGRWTFWNHVRTIACIGAAGFILYGAFQM